MKKSKYIFLSFIFPFMVMMIIIALREIYPFGDRSFLHMDMYHQYMPFFSEFMNKLKNGESLFYSWNVGMGSNFMALFAYYLASPVNWLVVLFPEKYLMEFMTYLIVIKIALCGVTFYLYLRYHFKAERYSMVFFSCFYALSGFIAAYNWDIMWLDNVILAPLIILGLEKLFYEKKFLMYTLTLGISILSDYYLSIMICIFVVLYLLVLLLKEPRRWKVVLPFAGSSLLAGGLAGVVLLPTYFALHFSEYGKFSFPKEISAYFPVWDVVARHFMNVATEQKTDHWPNIYCGVAVFLLIPIYVMCKKIDWREKLGKLVLMVFMLVSFSVNILAFIWHGFNYPNSLPARQSFLYIFLVLVICYEAYLQLESISVKVIGGSLAGALIFVVLCEKMLGCEGDFALDTYLLTGIFLVLYAALFWIKKLQKRVNKVFLVLVTIVVLLESGVNMADTSVSDISRTNYLDDLSTYDTLIARTKAKDTDFYRFEKWERMTKNDGNLVGYPSASVFSSTANSYIGDLYEKWGMWYSKVFYCFNGATPLTSALVNVKYMLSETLIADEGGLYELVDEQDGVYLYECRITLPLGYIVDERFQVPEEKLDRSEETPLDIQNRMVEEMINGDELFVKTGVFEEGEDVRLEIPEPGYYYVFSGSKATKNMSVYVDGMEFEHDNMGNGYILSVGYVEPDSRILVTCEEDVELDIAAYRMDMKNLETVIDALREQPFVVDSYSSTHINGHIQVKKAGELVLTVPYEPGWTMKVDGKEVEPEWYGKAFMSVMLTEGEHHIEMNYFPQGFTAGVIISLLSVSVLAGIWILQNRRNKRKAE